MSLTPHTLKLAVLVSSAACLVGCAGGSGSDTTTVTAHFANTNGLYEGNAVSVLGMRVGRIDRITARGADVEVRMSIDDSIRLPADVRAVTISDSILTDRHIELTPVYRDGPTLADGAVLDATRTKTPVEFDALLSMTRKLATSLGGDGNGSGPVADLIGLSAAATEGNGQEMRTALDELSRALRQGPDNGAAARAAITDIVTNLDSLTEAAARNDATLREFGRAIAQLGDFLADRRLGGGDTGATLNRIIAQVADLLVRHKDTISGLVGNANTLTGTLAAYDYNLAEFLDVFPLVTDNAYNAIDHNVGALRASVDLNRVLLDGQMVKEICNLLQLSNLGCATGSMRDMGPDFGITAILTGLAARKQGR
ncbi:MCE family protein [Nocardia bovistercoris]|uniref:MCE family protein n=1 Tax=Nocardia bovistercoris TaxID=2785916 RepID=A0A931IG36_9NOCA|nr:MCE family protein [Nocardia bovistercoris]MBH0779715.1 MCE family protein [Nocardia bovistercoris]